MNYSPDFCRDHFTIGVSPYAGIFEWAAARLSFSWMFKKQMARMHAQHSAFRFSTTLDSPGPTKSPGAPTPAPTCSSPACFSEMDTVSVQGMGAVKMSKLQLGDKVLTTRGYQTIYAFAHNDTTTRAQFLQIHTVGGSKPVEVTENHLIFVVDKVHPIRAVSVRKGDVLKGAQGALIVSKVERVERQGLYAPLTATGTIIVDGVVSSCYIALDHHSTDYLKLTTGVSVPLSHHFIAHTWLSPFRVVCAGLYVDLCNSFDDDTGFARVAQAGFSVKESLDRQGFVVQIFLLLVFLLLFALMRAVEYVLGQDNRAVFSLLIGVLAFLIGWRGRRFVNKK